jgi:Na+/melibiose symporter-like transporter
MKKSFPYARTFLLGFGFLGISIIWPVFNQFIPIFLQAGNPEFERQLLAEGRALPDIVGFGLAPSLALFIMTWDNLINLFVQPWVGERSDHTWTRIGRRKPWILLGMPIAVLGFIFVPVAQSVLAIAVFILITNFGMALFRSPTIAWLGDLFDPEDRSTANGAINMMGGVGGLLAYFGGGMLFNSFGRSAPFVGGAVAMIVALVVAVLFVREPRKQEAVPPAPSGRTEKTGVLANLRAVFHNPEKSGLFILLGILLWFMANSALDASLSSFAVFSLGMKPGTAAIFAGSMTISFIVFAIPAGLLAKKLGRRRTIQIGLVGLTILPVLAFYIVQGAAVFVAVLVLAGGLWALVNVNSLPMVYDYGDERKIGAYTGLYYFASQSAAVLGPTLGGILVDSMGDQYRWIWLFCAVFMGLAWLAMTQVREVRRAPVAAGSVS